MKYNKHRIYRNQFAGGTPISVRAQPIAAATNVDIYKVPAGHYLVLTHASVFNNQPGTIAFLEFVPEGFPDFPGASNNYIKGATIFLGGSVAINVALILTRNVIVPEKAVIRLGTESTQISGFFVILFGLLYRKNEKPFIDPRPMLPNGDL